MKEIELLYIRSVIVAGFSANFAKMAIDCMEVLFGRRAEFDRLRFMPVEIKKLGCSYSDTFEQEMACELARKIYQTYVALHECFRGHIAKESLEFAGHCMFYAQIDQAIYNMWQVISTFISDFNLPVKDTHLLDRLVVI